MTEVFRRTVDHLQEITLVDPWDTDSTATLRPTAEHRIWVDGKGWTAAVDLQIGDWVFREDGRRMEVIANRPLAGPAAVCTFRLSGDSVFYANGILVYELCGAPLPNQSPVMREVAP